MIAIVVAPDSAVAWNHRALDFAERSADPKAKAWLGSLYNNLGWTCHDRREYEAALDLFTKALARRKEQGQEVETRIAEWCVARTVRSLGRAEEALERQLALQREWEAAGGSDGCVEEEIAECLLLLDRAAEAKPRFARAYRHLEDDPFLSRDEPDRLRRMAELGGVERPER
jgi:tetratricopeptide (TPR) repeat protein